MSLTKRILQPLVDAAWHRLHGKRAAPQVQIRGFDAAKQTRLLYSWATDGPSMNRQLSTALRPLRARSRDLCQNNEYAKSFIHDLKANIIGPDGIRLQARSLSSDGTLDKDSNDAIEESWMEQCKPGQFEVTRRYSRITFENMLIETLARDGEAIIREVRGFEGNDSGIACQFIDPDYLDETYTTEKDVKTGNRVRMGVEIDKLGGPVAYHFRKHHPGERHMAPVTSQRIRVPANDITHVFVPMYNDMWRGVPWMHAGMIGLRDLGGYREAALVASRVGAAKMGFIATETGEGFTGDGKDSEGNIIMEAEPGSFDQVSKGTELLSWDPRYPHEQFETFNKAILRGISAGFGLSYHKLAKDLEGVNLSSARIGEINDRAMYMGMQKLLCEQACDDYYEGWITWQLTAGNIKNKKGQVLPFTKLANLKKHKWQPRRWKAVDEVKEYNANKGRVDSRMASLSSVIRDRGDDPEEVFLEIQQDQLRMVELNILPADAAGLFIPEPIDEEGDDAENKDKKQKN